MFEDAALRTKLGQLFGATTDRFDELLTAAGLNPRTDLIGADLRGANFSGSIMNGWNLSRCDLTGASFAGAKIRSLITDDAVGLDLRGAEAMDDIEEEESAETSNSFEWIVQQIRASTNGTQRGPLIEHLLSKYDSDERTWSFLLGQQIQRERVGRLVSLIASAWESRQEDPKAAGNRLRFQLLDRKGNPYVTVRARLLRELAHRLGPDDELFSVCKTTIEQEGYLTSGNTALSILVSQFAGDERAASYLIEIFSRKDWSGFRYQIAEALLEGFDNPSVRRAVEDAVQDNSYPIYERAGMLAAYYRTKGDESEVGRFLNRIFEADSEPQLRARALQSRLECKGWSGRVTPEELRAIVITDADYQVRAAALGEVGRTKEQLNFVLERATEDQSEFVRALAVRSADHLGYDSRVWYIRMSTDTADSVRGVALDRLIRTSQTPEERRELRDLLVKELTRSDPSFAAARAASILLSERGSDPTIPELVANMLARLPENTGGWNMSLRSKLRELGLTPPPR